MAIQAGVGCGAQGGRGPRPCPRHATDAQHLRAQAIAQDGLERIHAVFAQDHHRAEFVALGDDATGMGFLVAARAEPGRRAADATEHLPVCAVPAPARLTCQGWLLKS
jgi:hypothetical protein